MCAYWVERSAALATALLPTLGYAAAAELSKRSVREGVLIRDLITREQIVPAAEVEALLDLRRLTEIGMPGSQPAS
jgi:aspartate ammonia-lyase